MMSDSLQRFSQYPSVTTTTSSLSQMPASNTHGNGNDAFGHGSHYPITPHLTTPPQPGHGQHLYTTAATRSNSASGPVRRRISRACDQCNQLRTKCDGQHPCAHCVEFGLGCEYIRERKKRGKASRKELAAQAAAQAAAAAVSHTEERSPTLSGDNGSPGAPVPDSSSAAAPVPKSKAHEKAHIDPRRDPNQHSDKTGNLDSLAEVSAHQSRLSSRPVVAERDNINSPPSLDLNGFGNVQNTYSGQAMGGAPLMAGPSHSSYGANQPDLSNYTDMPYALQDPTPSSYSANASANYGIPSGSLGVYPIEETRPPGWNPIPSPPTQYQTRLPHSNYNQARYPVLNPLIPHLGGVIPLSLACDLIDLYFTSSSSAYSRPLSPYVLGFVFRKRSFTHPTKPRQCQPALLASMLWVAAQTSDAPFLTSVPSARGKICQKLLELTVSLLNPLIHTPSGEITSSTNFVIDGIALGGLGVALPGSMSLENLTGEYGPFGAAGSVDDVATYMHLATVISASEYKGASLRWWNAAWSLARELKLGRELPPSVSSGAHAADGNGLSAGGLGGLGGSSTPGAVTEEEREERRRIWWLVYSMDRHLALCYNRPLFLLDIECAGLLQPMDDIDWQSGDFEAKASNPVIAGNRVRGPHFECTGHSIFGYFLPLMTILGEIVDLHHARNHPRFGLMFRSAREWDDQVAEIARHLEAYEQSLKKFEDKFLHADETDPNSAMELTGDVDEESPSGRSIRTTSSRMTESDIQSRIVISYGTQIMHVLHILLTGKWDPIDLLDDNDLWISTQGFITATSHAVSAAEALSNILEYDPSMEFMPFFFGVYLLQGSFLLLLIADKLQLEASPAVVKACETIVRAHEACVVTLNTEYQRNFSKVMRSALALVRGRVPEDLLEQQARRRELLALYRWTGDGTGLAL